MVKSNNQKQYKNWNYDKDGNPEYWKYLSQEYYNQIGDLKARQESKKYIIYEAMQSVSAITHNEIERLLEIGRIQYININTDKKLEVCIKKKIYNEVLGIYEVPE